MPLRYSAALLLALLSLPALATIGAAGRPSPAAGAGEEAISILRRHCIACHNAGRASAGVDLSTRDAAMRVRPAGAALAPARPDASRLFRMVSQGKMPPTGRLPAAEVDTLRRWIARGAPYLADALTVVDPRAPLWSLQPVRRPAVPRTRFDRLARNPIDHFIFAELQNKGLQPSPPASRRELIRRVTLDLTALPPTPAEVRAFLSDRSANAYEKVVDRLLASPAYGECWARHWLDVVRFGESNGYEQNHLRPNAWPYRDYVIRALNRDEPYSRFVTEQIAGDVVGAGNPEIEAATGFLVAGVHDTVGIRSPEGALQQRANDLDDIVATTGAAFLGLTVGCARCHDHKFDPIPQRDYYRLTAVFAGVQHGERPLGMRRADDGRKSEDELRATSAALADLDERAREAVLGLRGVQPVPRPAVNARRNVEDFPPVRARFVRMVIDATVDGSQPCLDEIEVFGADLGQNLALASRGAKTSASSLLPGYAIHQVAHLNDGRWGNDWSWISNETGKGWAQIELAAAVPISRVVWSRDGGAVPRFTDRLPSAYRIEVSEDGKAWTVVARSADRAPAPEALDPNALLTALSPADRDHRAALLTRADRLRAALSAGVTMAYAGRFTAPEPTFLLRRGDVMQRAEPMRPGALLAIDALDSSLALAPEATDAQRRLALARWITSPANPLTPRVIVNRTWQGHFGSGLVGTPSDFGRNGEPPSHPELLDWLASVFRESNRERESAKERNREGKNKNSTSGAGRGLTAPADELTPASNSFKPFRALRSFALSRSRSSGPLPNAERLRSNAALGWSLKALHRLIVTSATYRQSSGASARGMAVDTSNRLLWRMPLRRMQAEAVRDSILSLSGKLDRRMGGPGFPLFQYRVVNVAIYEPHAVYGPETWRRSIYAQTPRAVRDDLLGGFDCPESSQREPRRDVTTTPLQALTLLNGRFSIQQASFMAERLRREAGPSPEAQIRLAFELAFGRPPDPAEARDALDLVRRRGLESVCRGVINANEFLYY
jgi:hypothetical protein